MWIRCDLHQLSDRDMRRLMEGCAFAFVLTHSLTEPRYTHLDPALARRIGAAAAAADAKTAYVGALGETGLSTHVASRQEVGAILRDTSDCRELRASVILGMKSASFRALVRIAKTWPPLVPMPMPKTRCQPISLYDAVACLLRACDLDEGIYEVGGREVITYADLVMRTFELVGRHRRPVFVPIRHIPRIATGVPRLLGADRRLLAELLTSVTVEMIVRDWGFFAITGYEPEGLDSALEKAFSRRSPRERAPSEVAAMEKARA